MIIYVSLGHNVTIRFYLIGLIIMLFSLFSIALANPEYQIGVEALQNKDFTRAETHLQNCVQANPQEGVSTIFLALVGRPRLKL